MSTKIEAQLLYHRLRDTKQGIYIWVDPSAESVLDLQELLKDCPFKIENGTGWHVTVLYCKGDDLPKEIDVPKPISITGRVSHLALWDNHKGDEIAVLILDSDDLKGLNRKLVKQGLPHSFPDYTPHLTLSYNFENTPESRLFIDELNEYLMNYPVFLTFDGLKASELDGST